MAPPPQLVPTPSSRMMWRSGFWAILLTSLIFGWAHQQAFLSPFVINDDVRQQVAWMQVWRDPGLFQDDLLTDFGRKYVSYGVHAVYRLANLVIDPIGFSKILTGLLYVVLGGVTFGIGWRVAGPISAWGLCCVYWILPFFLHNISGGLARAFAGPLLAVFVLSWMARRSALMAVTLLALACFIPYMFVLCAMAVGLAWLGAKVLKERLRPEPPFLGALWHWGVLGLGALLVWQFSHALDAAGYGPLIDRAGMEGRAVFSSAGRLHILPVPSLFQEAFIGPIERLLPTRELGAFAGTGVAIALGGVLLWGALRAPWGALRPLLPMLGALGLASLLLYVLARALVMQLFVPTRYVEYTVAMAHVLLLGMALAGVLRAASGAGGLRRWAPAIIGVFAFAGALRLEGQALYDYSRDVPLYDAVQRLPKDAMMAGHPFLMDNVLTFGQRKVLVSFELAHPWCVGLWEQLEPRLDGFFAAYYAADAQAVLEFADAFGVDWLVVDSRHFADDFFHWPVRDVPICEAGQFGPLRGLCQAVTNATVKIKAPRPDVYPVTPPFFQPYRDRIQEATQGRGDLSFILLDETVFPGTRVNEFIRLVPLRREGP